MQELRHRAETRCGGSFQHASAGILASRGFYPQLVHKSYRFHHCAKRDEPITPFLPALLLYRRSIFYHILLIAFGRRSLELGNEGRSFFFVLIPQAEQLMVLETICRQDGRDLFFEVPVEPGLEDTPSNFCSHVIYDHVRPF